MSLIDTGIDQPEGSRLRPYHRMPVEYGPAAGPRNVPDDVELPTDPERRTSVAFTVPVIAATSRVYSRAGSNWTVR